jgi:hypothetical protein
MPMRWTAVLSLGVLLLLLPGRASADTTFASANLPGYGGIVMLQPFDTNLGTLDSVEVTIDGTITANILTQPNYAVVGGAAIPIPIDYLVAGTQNFIGGGGGSGFSWEVPATFLFSGLGLGFGEPEASVDVFNYSFRFTHQTDLIGFAGISSSGPTAPPGVAFGTLSGFTSPILPFLLENMDLEGGDGSGGTFLDSTVEGAIIVEYDYTPTPLPTAPASEPATLLLLASGILGLAAYLRAWL